MKTAAPFHRIAILALCASISIAAQFAQAQQSLPLTLPEQRSLDLPDPSRHPSRQLPSLDLPYTVSSAIGSLKAHPLTLDQAIRMALENAEVVRVLGGVSASTSGRTIYDVAISNTGIDDQNALFDPSLSVTSNLGKQDQARDFDSTVPGFTGSSSDSVSTSVGLSQRMFNGADIGLNITPVGSHTSPGLSLLNPQYTNGVEMSLRQPLMRGFGRDVNLVPIVVARIDTERSYFQYKDAVQELVRSAINGYWSLVAARVEVWARQQQVEQAEFAFQRAQARKEEGFERAADVAQARSALANFRANLISARSNLILTETALRNLLGLPPSGDSELVPVSVPIRERAEFDWAQLVTLAERQRPDIIELKLILEADEQLLLQAGNSARPTLDGVANYRWDGISGELPSGTTVRSGPGQFAGWNVGVEFSVPIGLRKPRAALRQRELVICRDEANLKQGLHQMIHDLTTNYRNIAQFYEQIEAFGEARRAALVNYENQIGEFQADRKGFLDVLQAITDWGNSVAQEARSVNQYNSELASIQRNSGSILESHGIVFYEERFSSLGPLGRLGSQVAYPSALPAVGDETPRYPDSGKPAEAAFDLQDLSSHIKNQNENADPPQAEPETPPPPMPDDSGSRIDQPLPEFKSSAEIPRSFTKLKELVR